MRTGSRPTVARLLSAFAHQRASVLSGVSDLDERAGHSGYLEIARELLDGRTNLGLR